MKKHFAILSRFQVCWQSNCVALCSFLLGLHHHSYICISYSLPACIHSSTLCVQTGNCGIVLLFLQHFWRTVPVHIGPCLPTVPVPIALLPIVSLHTMILPTMSLPTVPLPALQAAFKRPAAAAQTWDWGLVKAEDKTLVHQVHCPFAAAN